MLRLSLHSIQLDLPRSRIKSEGHTTPERLQMVSLMPSVVTPNVREVESEGAVGVDWTGGETPDIGADAAALEEGVGGWTEGALEEGVGGLTEGALEEGVGGLTEGGVSTMIGRKKNDRRKKIGCG